MKLGIAFHRRAAIDADVDHRDAIEDATIILGSRVEGFDHEPLIGIANSAMAPPMVANTPAIVGPLENIA